MQGVLSNGKVEPLYRPKWPIGPALHPVSLALSG